MSDFLIEYPAAAAASLIVATALALLLVSKDAFAKLSRTTTRRSKPKDSTPASPTLYSASHPRESCDDEYDVIVIGSGIGGLTAASLLAQRNYKVLVLEQHIVCGGCCHEFVSGGYRFGTGIHYVGTVEGSHDWLPKAVLNSITYKDDPIQWDPLPTNFDTLFLGTPPASRRYEIISGGFRAQKQRLKEQFPPEEHAAIDRYYTLIHDAAASWRNAAALKVLPLFLTKLLVWTGLYKLLDGGYHKYASMTVMDVVSSLTDNEDLRAVMCYNWGDHGCVPEKAPFVLQAGLVAHYVYGAYYPHGGTKQIAQKIIPTITDNGGRVLANAPVTHITVSKWTGRADGVEMKDGRQIKATKGVISDAGLYDTLQHLLPPALECRERMISSLFGDTGNDKKLHRSVTGVYLCVGLKGDHDTDLHLPHTQHWTYPSGSAVLAENMSQLTLEEGFKLEPKDFFLFIVSPSGKDKAWKEQYPGKSTLEIITFVPSTWFEDFMPENSAELGGMADPGGKPGSHGTKYEAAKKKIADLMWTRTVEVLAAVGATDLPRTLNQVDHYQIGSPLTFAHYYRRDGGAFYGTQNDMARYDPINFFEHIRPEISEVPGLYITGQDASAPGFVGAMMGGLLSASKVVGALNPMSLLVQDGE